MVATLKIIEVPACAEVLAHEHARAHFCTVLKGSLIESDARERHRLQRGDTRLSPPAIRDLRFGRIGARCVVAEIEPASSVDITSAIRAKAPAWLFQGLSDLGTSWQSENWQFDADLLVMDTVAWMLARGERQAVSPAPWLRDIRDAIREGEVASVGRLAREAGVHRVHLSRTFHAAFGLPLSVYLQRVRLTQALQLLRRTEGSLAAIAAEAGFFDQAHLCRALRRNFNATPSAVRTMLHASNTDPERFLYWSGD